MAVLAGQMESVVAAIVEYVHVDSIREEEHVKLQEAELGSR